MFSRGIFSVGLISEGIFTLSMVGTGLLLFVGSVGGGFGLGVYQVGISWFCYVGQMTLSIWDTKSAQLGVNVISPVVDRKKKQLVTCADSR